MKTYWVFWTYMANHASHPCQVEAENIVKAMKAGTLYDPYKADDNGNRIRFIVFEEGGTLVWDGPAPKVEDSPGNIVMGSECPQGTLLDGETGVSEHANDLDWLYEVHVGPDTQHKLPDHMVPFGLHVKFAVLVGNEDAPDAIYLSTKAKPEVSDHLYRFK
jgi:hypothetical protein